MHDAGAWRYDTKRLEGRHAPLQELVAFAIAPEFELHVEVERVGAAVVIDGDRVIDDQIDRHPRFDACRIVALGCRRIAHRREIGKQRNAGKVLQHHAGDDKGNFVQALGVGAPFGELPDVIVGHQMTVAVAQHRFEHDAQGAGQAAHVGETAAQDRQRFDEAPAGHAGKRNPAVGQVVHGNIPGLQRLLIGGLPVGLATARCVPSHGYQSLSGADFVFSEHLFIVGRVIPPTTAS